MTNFITGIIGIAGVCAFLGILLWWIKALPLIIIVGLVVVLLLTGIEGVHRQFGSTVATVIHLSGDELTNYDGGNVALASEIQLRNGLSVLVVANNVRVARRLR